jgi:dTDP-3-amino-3,4,6-trideoxy-alpha-D-glucose transaminase
MIVPFADISRENMVLVNQLKFEFGEMISQSNFILGPALDNFEKKFAEYVGSKYVIGVGNGTDAIEIALRSYGLPERSKVIVPAMTFAASAIGVMRAELTPVFVDVDEYTSLLDLNITEDMLKRGAKAIIAVHLYGQPADIENLNTLCEKYGAILIADAAQAHGAKINGKRLGECNETSTYSFYPTKNLGAFGDGGAIATNSNEVEERCKKLRNYGSATKYFHNEFGFNSRLDEIQAKFLTLKLENLDESNFRREQIAFRYLEGLAECESIQLPKIEEFNTHVWHLFPIKSAKRNAFQDQLTGMGITTAIHYPISLPDQIAFNNFEYYFSGNSNSRLWAEQQLSLPMFPNLSEVEVKRVIDCIKQISKDNF